MVMQGVMCLLFGDSDLMVDWGKGSVVIGGLFWVGWAIAVRLGVEMVHGQDMHNTGV